MSDMSDVSDVQSPDNLSRRKALKMIAGSVSAAVSLPVLGEGAARAAVPTCRIARRTAELPAHPPKFFRSGQIRALEALSETIIPADDHSPGAKAARVWEYIDDIVADSNQTNQGLWTAGLAAIDQIAERDYGKNFGDCAAEQQIALLEKLSQNEDKPTSPQEKFFVEIKRATIDGYYTSPIGIHQEIEYQGNVAQAEFIGCTHPEHKGQ